MRVRSKIKQAMRLLLITIMLGTLIIVCRVIGNIEASEDSIESELYKKYKYPNEKFLGQELYSEIDYKCSEYEAEVGNLVVDRVRTVAEYTGCEEDAVIIGEIGELNKFYFFNITSAVRQDVTLSFITCKISGNEGRIWVSYSRKCYDKNGEECNSSSDALMVWYIENIDGVWNVVKNREAA